MVLTVMRRGSLSLAGFNFPKSDTAQLTGSRLPIGSTLRSPGDRVLSRSYARPDPSGSHWIFRNTPVGSSR